MAQMNLSNTLWNDDSSGTIALVEQLKDRLLHTYIANNPNYSATDKNRIPTELKAEVGVFQEKLNEFFLDHWVDFQRFLLDEGVDPTTIDSWKEVQEFLEGLPDDETMWLKNKLAALDTAIAGIDQDGIGIFDVSAYNNIGGTYATYNGLSAALAAIPTASKRSGMTIRYIDSTSNQYKEYRYFLQYEDTTAGNTAFNNTANWQGIDSVPTSSSTNLVQSGGVEKAIHSTTGLLTCSTTAETAAKTISDTDFALPSSGGNIKVKFTYANTASSPTLNINSTGAKAILYNGAVASSSNSWEAGEVVEFYFDPTYNSNAGAWVGVSYQAEINQLDQEISQQKMYKSTANRDLSLCVAELFIPDFYGDSWCFYKLYSDAAGDVRLQDSAANVVAKATPTANNKVYPLIVTNSTDSTNYPVGKVVGYVIFRDYSSFLSISAGTSSSVINNAYVTNIHNSPFIALAIDTNNLIPDNTLDGDKLLDGSVEAEKLVITTSVASKNLLNPDKIVTNRWIKSNGTTDTVSSDYGYYDYLPVEPNTQYHISNKDGNALSNRSDCYIAFYSDASISGFISSVASNTSDITTPATAAFVRISVVMARVTGKDAMMEKGTSRTDYEPYSEPTYKIKPQYIQLPDDIPGEKIENGTITQEKLAEGIITTAKPKQFKGWFASSDSIAAGGGQIVIADKVFRCRKGFQYTCVVTGAVGNLRLLIGDLYIDVTSSTFSVNGGASQSHGLTLGAITTFILDCGNDKNITSNTSFRIVNDAGETYVKTGVDFRIFNGYVGIQNNNSSTPIGAKVSVFNKDLTKEIWMFGDSYFSYIDPSRWVYYLMQWGYIHYLLNAKSGENATQALNDFNMMLESGFVPSYVVWCLGMNDAADENGSVNSTWMTKTNALIDICGEKGIEIVFATIPSVPGIPHVALNNWIRSSGYRYVDFADAVEDPEQGGNNYWRLWGSDPASPSAGSLLSSDKVHPTQYGAVELCARFLADFPEITTLL